MQSNAINYPFTPITSYTPVLSSSGGGESVSYVAQTGTYSVNNGVCTLAILLVATVTGTPSGAAQISVPLACTQQLCRGVGRYSLNSTYTTIPGIMIQFGTSQCNVTDPSTGLSMTLSTGLFNISGTITYFVG